MFSYFSSKFGNYSNLDKARVSKKIVMFTKLSQGNLINHKYFFSYIYFKLILFDKVSCSQHSLSFFFCDLCVLVLSSAFLFLLGFFSRIVCSDVCPFSAD